ncbi:MAG: N-acetyltransferase family protein [Rhodobacteraceae bacterium]|nr:N-acetyltransferase family protein [Paracoccaceae bacterium]
MHLRPATEADLPDLLEIHNFAVRNLAAAWTEHEDTLEDRRAWLKQRQGADLPVLLAIDDEGRFLGYGTYGSFRGRSGYNLTVEHSIYVRSDVQSKGVGRLLLETLIADAREKGYHVMIGAVDSDNEQSLKFHQKLGFEVSSKLPQIGTKFGRWLDLYFVILILNDDDAPPSILPPPADV